MQEKIVARSLGIPFLLLVVSSCASAQSTRDQRISESVLPLPAALRAGAAVIAYEPGAEPDVLREGTNNWICETDTSAPDIFLRCLHGSLEPFRNRDRELVAEGRTTDEIRQILETEMQSGVLEMPDHAMEFLMEGSIIEHAMPWAIVRIPFATQESTGLPTEPSPYHPWLMRPGEGNAHIMLPGK